MDRQTKPSRCPTKRPALAAKQARTQPGPGERQFGEARATKALSMPKPVDLLTGSSPRMPHHDSLQPEDSLGTRNNPVPPPALLTADNKRISAVASGEHTNRSEERRVGKECRIRC